MNTKKYKESIKRILTINPEARDSDSYLLGLVWHKELKEKGVDPKKISSFEFLKMLKQKIITTPESITRSRRKIQESYPGLRGDRYYARIKYQDDVKHQIQTFSDGSDY